MGIVWDDSSPQWSSDSSKEPAEPRQMTPTAPPRRKSYSGMTAGEVSEDVLRQINENPERRDEIFAKMKAKQNKGLAEYVNSIGGGAGPVGRGAVRGAEGVGRFAVNSFLRGMSYVPGFEDWEKQADHNNRLAQIQQAYDTYQDETGTTSEFTGATLAKFSGALSETATQALLLGKLGSGTRAAKTPLGMSAFMAASYGAMDAERALTSGHDAGLRGWRKNTYAAGMGSLSAALTYGFGLAADKLGGKTAEELLSRGAGRMVDKLLSWNGLKREIVDMTLEGGEEESIAAMQGLWGSAFGTNDWETYKQNAGQAFIQGAAARGSFGALRRLQAKFEKAVSEIPKTAEALNDTQEVGEKVDMSQLSEAVKELGNRGAIVGDVPEVPSIGGPLPSTQSRWTTISDVFMARKDLQNVNAEIDDLRKQVMDINDAKRKKLSEDDAIRESALPDDYIDPDGPIMDGDEDEDGQTFDAEGKNFEKVGEDEEGFPVWEERESDEPPPFEGMGGGGTLDNNNPSDDIGMQESAEEKAMGDRLQELHRRRTDIEEKLSQLEQHVERVKKILPNSIYEKMADPTYERAFMSEAADQAGVKKDYAEIRRRSGLRSKDITMEREKINAPETIKKQTADLDKMLAENQKDEDSFEGIDQTLREINRMKRDLKRARAELEKDPNDEHAKKYVEEYTADIKKMEDHLKPFQEELGKRFPKKDQTMDGIYEAIQARKAFIAEAQAALSGSPEQKRVFAEKQAAIVREKQKSRDAILNTLKQPEFTLEDVGKEAFDVEFKLEGVFKDDEQILAAREALKRKQIELQKALGQVEVAKEYGVELPADQQLKTDAIRSEIAAAEMTISARIAELRGTLETPEVEELMFQRAELAGREATIKDFQQRLSELGKEIYEAQQYSNAFASLARDADLAAEQQGLPPAPEGDEMGTQEQKSRDDMLNKVDEDQIARDRSDLVSIQHKYLRQDAEFFKLDEMPPRERKAWMETIQEVRDDGSYQQVMDIARDTINNNLVWNRVTKARVAEGYRIKLKEYYEIAGAIESAPPGVNVDDFLAREHELRREIQFINRAADLQQSEAGDSFNFSKLIMRLGGEVERAMRRARRSKGADLDDDETKAILDEGAKIDRIEKEMNHGKLTSDERKELDDAADNLKNDLTDGQGEESAGTGGPQRPRTAAEKKISTEAEKVEKVIDDYIRRSTEEKDGRSGATPEDFDAILRKAKSVLYNPGSTDFDRNLMFTSMDQLLSLAERDGNFTQNDRKIFSEAVSEIKNAVPHEGWKVRKLIEEFENRDTAVLPAPKKAEFDKALSKIRRVLKEKDGDPTDQAAALDAAKRLAALANKRDDFETQDKAVFTAEADKLAKKMAKRRAKARAENSLTAAQKIEKLVNRLKEFNPDDPVTQVVSDELDTMAAKVKKVYTDPDVTQEDRDALFMSVQSLQNLVGKMGAVKPGSKEWGDLDFQLWMARENLNNLTYYKDTKSLAERAKRANAIWHETVLTGDLSHMGIQGGIMALMNPKLYAQKLVEGFKNGLSSEQELRHLYDLYSGPYGDLFKDDMVTFMKPDMGMRQGEDPGYRGLADIIGKWHPGAGKLAAVLPRLYRVSTNAMRAGLFGNIVEAWGGRGNFTRQELESIGSIVDTFTLRGGRGYLDKHIQGINLFFLAPRNYMAYLELLSGYHFWKKGNRNPKMFKIVASQYGKMARGWGSFYLAAAVANLFAALAGREEEVVKTQLDPMEPRFLQMKVGDTWFDPSMRLGKYLSTLARGARSVKKGQTGERVSRRDGSMYDDRQVNTFLRGKLSFPAGTMYDLYSREDIMGNPVTLPNLLANRMTPITPREIFKAAKEQGTPEAVLRAIFEGTGFQADFEDPHRRRRRNRN